MEYIVPNGKNILIGGFYRQWGENQNMEMSEITSSIDKSGDEEKHIVILSNMNLDKKRFNERDYQYKSLRDQLLNCLANNDLIAADLTWRHDSIVKYLVDYVDKTKFTVYADIDGKRTNAKGTIPPNVNITSVKPDIVIIKEDELKVFTFELTVPHIDNIKRRHLEKEDKYQLLRKESKPYDLKSYAFEIEIRGHITKDNEITLKKIYSLGKKNIPFKAFINNISKIAISSSYYIFMCRDQKEWSNI